MNWRRGSKSSDVGSRDSGDTILNNEENNKSSEIATNKCREKKSSVESTIASDSGHCSMADDHAELADSYATLTVEDTSSLSAAAAVASEEKRNCIKNNEDVITKHRLTHKQLHNSLMGYTRQQDTVRQQDVRCVSRTKSLDCNNVNHSAYATTYASFAPYALCNQPSAVCDGANNDNLCHYALDNVVFRDQLSSSETVTNSHHQPPSGTVTNSHDQPPLDTVTNSHDQPPLDTVANSYDRLPSDSVINSRDQPQSGSVTSCQDQLPSEIVTNSRDQSTIKAIANSCDQQKSDSRDQQLADSSCRSSILKKSSGEILGGSSGSINQMKHAPKIIYSRSQDRLMASEGSRPIVPFLPFSPCSSPSGSPRSRRLPTRETRQLSIVDNGGYTQLNQYKLKEDIGKVFVI